MGHYWQQLTPGDTFIVYRELTPANDEQNRLLQLYQPIIGSTAVSLYLTLSACLSGQCPGGSEPDVHRSLMALMNLPLDEIVEARELLEGTGLIRVKRHIDENEARRYFYYVQPPLTGTEFFSSDVLSVILYHRLGKVKYRDIRSRFLPAFPYTVNALEMTDVTKGFDEVFKSIAPSELMVQPGTESFELLFDHPYQQTAATSTNDSTSGITLKQPPLDFEEIIARMGRVFQPEKKLTPSVRTEIQEIAFFYQCDEALIVTCLHDQRVYTKEDHIDVDKVRDWIKEKYREQYGQRPPAIVAKRNLERIVAASAASDRPALTDAEQHRQRLETMSPLALLEAYQQGGKVAAADVQLVEGLINDFELDYSVVNALIDYVMLSNDMKLPRALTEKIAGHWKRSGISTVSEAQALAKREHKMYYDWKDKKQSGSTSRSKPAKAKSEKTDKLPASLQEQLRREKEGSGPANTSMSDEEWQKKEARALEMLRALGEID